MKNSVLIVLGLAALAGIGYAYYSATSVPTPTVGAKGKKQAGDFRKNNTLRIGSKSGINANVNLPGAAGDWAGLINGIWHPTNQNSFTNTATSQATSETTASSATTT